LAWISDFGNFDFFFLSFFSAFNIYGMKLFQFWYYLKPLYRMTESYRRERSHIANGFVKKGNEMIIDKQRELSASENEQKNVLSFLLQRGQKLSHEEIRDELNTFIVAVSLHFNQFELPLQQFQWLNSFQ
jgi:hypothetical protein